MNPHSLPPIPKRPIRTPHPRLKILQIQPGQPIPNLPQTRANLRLHPMRIRRLIRIPHLRTERHQINLIDIHHQVLERDFQIRRFGWGPDAQFRGTF